MTFVAQKFLKCTNDNLLTRNNVTCSFILKEINHYKTGVVSDLFSQTAVKICCALIDFEKMAMAGRLVRPRGLIFVMF